MDAITDKEIIDWLEANCLSVKRDIGSWLVIWWNRREPLQRTGPTLRAAATAAILADREYRAKEEGAR